MSSLDPWDALDDEADSLEEDAEGLFADQATYQDDSDVHDQFMTWFAHSDKSWKLQQEAQLELNGDEIDEIEEVEVEDEEYQLEEEFQDQLQDFNIT